MMKKLIVFFLFLFLIWTSGDLRGALRQGAPEEVAVDGSQFWRIDKAINDLIVRHITPGAIVAVGRGDKICFLKSYGNRQEFPTPEPMTLDTVFDMASVTKVAATALSIHILIDRGLLNPDDPVCRYLPEYTGNGKEKITIRQCLTHTTGIDQNYTFYGSKEEIWKSMCAVKLITPPGEIYRYSCPGFIVLGKVVERISGLSLRDFTINNIYAPLGMTDTMFLPTPDLRRRCAATLVELPSGSQQRKPQLGDKSLKGLVSDFRSRGYGGVTGNAGLFSTVNDLSVLASVLLNKGKYKDKNGKEARLFSEETFMKMIAPVPVSQGIRGNGWDKRSDKDNRGFFMSPEAVGHGGWTGTSFWIDPQFNLFVIVLTTRTHYNVNNPNIYPTAGYIASLVIDSLRDSHDAPKIQDQIRSCICDAPFPILTKNETSVKSGLDLLRAMNFSILEKKKIALITDDSAVGSDGSKLNDLLTKSDKVISAEFHAVDGKLFRRLSSGKMEAIKENRILPPMVPHTDLFVFDMTFSGDYNDPKLNMLLRALQTAVDLGKPFILLDRKNQQDMKKVSGSLPETGQEAKFGFARIPKYYAMSPGELALFLNFEYRMNMNLTIVPFERPDFKLQSSFSDISGKSDFARFTNLRFLYLIYKR